MNRFDNKPIDYTSTDILVFACVRNERLRLPYFLNYHRSIGVNRFFIVDNGSDDDSKEILAAQADVYLFETKESYAESNYGIDWINELLNEFGSGHWTLTLDADELLIFPYSEKILLPKLCSYLQSQGSDSLQTFMLDMYSNKPMGKTVIQQNQPFLEVCNYFDGDTYMFLTPGADLKPEYLRGGVRSRVFWRNNNRELPPPFLGKIPLVHWKHGMSFKASTHLLDAKKAVDITGILLHFKFFSDFLERVPDEVVRDEHWKGAIQYQYYNDIIKRNPDLNLAYTGSVAYEDTRQLIQMGFMKSSDNYENYCLSTPGSR